MVLREISQARMEPTDRRKGAVDAPLPLVSRDPGLDRVARESGDGSTRRLRSSAERGNLWFCQLHLHTFHVHRVARSVKQRILCA